MTTISVIVPVYNVEKYLPHCIDSILAQTFTDFEVLLIDDGSTDNSGKICDEYAVKDSRIRVFHKKNGGVSSARNLGLEEAKGDYVIFLDSDDYYTDKNCLNILYNEAIIHHLDIVRGEYQAVDGEGSPILSQKVLSRQHFAGKIMTTDHFLKDVIQGEFFSVLMLIRRSKLNETFFPIHKIFLEDMYFIMYLFQQDLRCEYIQLAFYAYRKIESSASNVPKVQNLKDSFDMCDTFASLADQSYTKQMKNYCRHRSVMMYYWTLQTLARREYFHNRKHIIASICLDKLQKRTFTRVWKYGIINYYIPFMAFPPLQGCRLLHLKDYITGKLHLLLQTHG